jgi:hypothetical protein
MVVAQNLLVVAILMVLVGAINIVEQGDIWKYKKPSKDTVNLRYSYPFFIRLGLRKF